MDTGYIVYVEMCQLIFFQKAMAEAAVEDFSSTRSGQMDISSDRNEKGDNYGQNNISLASNVQGHTEGIEITTDFKDDLPNESLNTETFTEESKAKRPPVCIRKTTSSLSDK